MAKTRIDWADESVNIFTGCRQGCEYCYARRMAWRLAHVDGTVYNLVAALTGGNPHEPTSGGDPFAPAFHTSVYERNMMRLEWARKPKRVFVGSMGDMCFEGEALAIDWSGGNRIASDSVQALTAHFAAEIQDRGHKVLVLTKRPDLLAAGIAWPRNLHLGVSVTSDTDAGRVRALLARVRDDAMLRWGTRPGKLWVSVEPLLGDLDPECLVGLNWVVVGFDSRRGVYQADGGPRLRKIVDWCRAHGVPVFCKDSCLPYWVTSEALPREFPR